MIEDGFENTFEENPFIKNTSNENSTKHILNVIKMFSEYLNLIFLNYMLWFDILSGLKFFGINE